jgi:hypothetical protein
MITIQVSGLLAGSLPHVAVEAEELNVARATLGKIKVHPVERVHAVVLVAGRFDAIES